MKHPKKSPSDKTLEYVASLPPHPRQADLLNAAIKHLADAVVSAAAPEAPVTQEEALEGARSEFETGLLAMIHSRDEDRFRIVWKSAAWARALKSFVQTAWESEPGAYGKHRPVHHDPKRLPSNLN